MSQKSVDFEDVSAAVRRPNSNFFESSSYEQREKPVRQTFILDSEQSEDGTIKIVEKSVESSLDPLSSLRFSDFSIMTLLKSGINPKSLSISPDLRLGHDAEIEAFNSRLESLSSQLFNPEI